MVRLAQTRRASGGASMRSGVAGTAGFEVKQRAQRVIAGSELEPGMAQQHRVACVCVER